PERLTLRCSLHFIHKGVKPLWEDPKNEHGGAWNFRTAKGDTAFVWRELLMALIGEQFEDTISKSKTATLPQREDIDIDIDIDGYRFGDIHARRTNPFYIVALTDLCSKDTNLSTDSKSDHGQTHGNIGYHIRRGRLSPEQQQLTTHGSKDSIEDTAMPQF
ncbi:hypothetical protein BG011_009665, partial [Mortierella polycephala]